MMRKPLPPTGRPTADVLAELRRFGDADPDYRNARLWSLVYYLDEGHAEFLAEAQRAFASANGLNPTAFKSLKRFETEVIAATTELLHGGDEACGVLTSGGTESCLLAVKTYRDLARVKRRVRRPEMIVPRSAHVAWFKAAEYFGVKLRILPLDDGFRADVRGIEKLINRKVELEPVEVDDERPRRSRRDDDDRRSRSLTRSAERPARAPAPRAPVDPFFDQPYEPSQPAPAAPAVAEAPKPGRSPPGKSKKKLASLLGG